MNHPSTNNSTNPWSFLPFALTIFTSAFLLFQVQPLISKQILPWFGGSPAVWTTAMLFFQSLLCLGYFYAHALASLSSRKTQARIHVAVLILAALLASRCCLGSICGPIRPIHRCFRSCKFWGSVWACLTFVWPPQAPWYSTGLPTRRTRNLFSVCTLCPTWARFWRCFHFPMCSSLG